MDRSQTYFLQGEALSYAVERSIVHVEGSHDLEVDLEEIEGNGQLVVLPYEYMAAGDTLYVEWLIADQTSPVELQHSVQQEEVGEPLTFSLERDVLDESLNQICNVHYVVVDAGDRERRSQTQAFKVLSKRQSTTPYLKPPYIADMPPGQIEALPDGVEVQIPGHEQMLEGDELLLYVKGQHRERLIGHRVTVDDLDNDAVPLLLDGPFLIEHLQTPIELHYGIARHGQALAAEPLTLQVVAAANITLDTVVHFKQAIDERLYLGDFRGAGKMTIVPYPKMAAGDSLTVHLASVSQGLIIASQIHHTVSIEEVGKPLVLTV